MSTGFPSKFHLPNWTLTVDPLSQRTCSASIENSVHLRRIRFVVNDVTVYFDPGMGLEGHLLRPDDHLRRHTVLFQQTCSSRGSLQAQRFFPIPDAGHVHGRADTFHDVGDWLLSADRVIADLGVKGGKISPRQVELEVDQFQVRFQDKKRYKKNLQFNTCNCNS